MRENVGGAQGGNVLWVCDRCFKYMSEGTSWESHMVSSWLDWTGRIKDVDNGFRGGAR